MQGVPIRDELERMRKSELIELIEKLHNEPIPDLQHDLDLTRGFVSDRQHVVEQLRHRLFELSIERKLPPDYSIHLRPNTIEVRVNPGYVFGEAPKPQVTVILANEWVDRWKIERIVGHSISYIERELRERRNEEVEFMYNKLKEAVQEGKFTVDDMPLCYIPVGDYTWNERIAIAGALPYGLPQDIGDLKKNPMAIFYSSLVGLNEYNKIAGRLKLDFDIDLPRSPLPQIEDVGKKRIVVIGAPFYEVSVY